MPFWACLLSKAKQEASKNHIQYHIPPLQAVKTQNCHVVLFKPIPENDNQMLKIFLNSQ